MWRRETHFAVHKAVSGEVAPAASQQEARQLGGGHHLHRLLHLLRRLRLELPACTAPQGAPMLALEAKPEPECLVQRCRFAGWSPGSPEASARGPGVCLPVQWAPTVQCRSSAV